MPISATSGAGRPGPSSPAGWTAAALAGGAAALAASALWNVARARRAEREHPPSGRFVAVDGVRLHYLERGAGPPVVLLHGNLVNAEDWALSGVLEQTAATCRTVAIDRPGFGYSDRPAEVRWTAAAQAALLREAMARLRLVRPVLVAHSWATLVALELALADPRALGGLVLVSGYYRPTARLDVPPAALPAVPVLGKVLQYTVSPLLGRALLPLSLEAMFAPDGVPDRFRRGFPYGFPVRPSQVRAQAEEAAAMVPTAARLRQRYRELRLPVSIVAGTEDRIVDCADQAVWLHHELPDSDLLTPPGLGHMLHHAAPGLIAHVVRRMGQVEEEEFPTLSVAGEEDPDVAVDQLGRGALAGV